MTASSTYNLNIFPIVVNSDEYILSSVHPLKQRVVSSILDYLKHTPEVKRAILFGSSVTPYCTSDSDIDICIEYNDTSDKAVYNVNVGIATLCEGDCDILRYDKLVGNLKTEIDTSGVVIYNISS